MALLTRLFAGAPKTELRTSPASPEISKLFGAGWTTPTGVEVTPTSALTNTGVLAAVRVLSESAAMLPLLMYERLERGKRRAVEHPLYTLLHDAPNPEQTAMEFREISITHMVLWGNFYAELEINRGGRVLALWPLRPDRIRISRKNGDLIYHYRPSATGAEHPLLGGQVLHIPGMGYDGVAGQSLIGLARNAVGLGLATEEYGSRFFGNGARPGGVLEHPGSLSDKAYDRLKDSWDATHRGLEAAQRIAILEEGVKYQQIGIPPEDAQFLQTRQFQITEIARIMRVQPHLLADLEHATFSNIEHLSLEFVTFSLMPWLVRWEQRVGLNLLTPTERPRYFAQHLVDGLLRGDIQTRYAAYALGRNWGFLSANDVREYENMNPIDGGDIYLSPLNMAEADSLGAPPAPPAARALTPAHAAITTLHSTRAADSPDPGARARRRIAASYQPAMADVVRRLVNREANDILNAARRYLAKNDSAGFLDWLRRFYDELRPTGLQYLLPSFQTLAGLIVDQVNDEMDAGRVRPGVDGMDMSEASTSYLERRIAGWMGTHQARITAAVDRALGDGNLDAVVEVEAEIDAIKTDDPEEFSRQHTVSFANFVAKLAFAALGVLAFAWTAFGDSCPYCKQLNGKTVDLEGYFLQPGDALDADGHPTYETKHLISHPPLHAGCDCGIRPA